MRARQYAILISILVCNMSFAQSIETVADLPSDFLENSGIEHYGNGILYFIMDGGNPNHIYRYDTSNSTYTEKVILGATNVDWEDLTQDDSGNMFIGDIGNNGNSRTDLVIYKIPNPEFEGDTIQAEKIEYSYENQTAFPPSSALLNFDCEAMAWENDSIYLFSKNRTNPYTGLSYMYVLPDAAGSYTARLRDSFNAGGATKEFGWITSADIYDDKLVLLSSSKGWLFTSFGQSSLSEVAEMDFGHFTQKEAICFTETSFRDFFISDEEFAGIGNKLYYFDFIVISNRQHFSKPKVVCSNGFLMVKNAKSNWEIEVFNINGNEVLLTNKNEYNLLDISHLKQGPYIISLQNGEQVHFLKWVKIK